MTASTHLDDDSPFNIHHTVRARAEFGHQMFATVGTTLTALLAAMFVRTGTTRGS